VSEREFRHGTPRGTSSRMTSPRIEEVALRLPDWMGSIRFRLTVLYSLVLFGLAGIVVGGIYLAIAARLDDDSMARTGSGIFVQIRPDGSQVIEQVETSDLVSFEEQVNRRSLQLLKGYSFSALGLLFIASLGVGWFIAGRVLAPIDRITAVARDIQATDLARRIDLRGPPDELKDLADTFDDMLGRLDEAFQQQRRFIQEASHELRNPLAVIRTNLEVTLDDPDASVEDLRATADVVNRSTARMSVLVDDLLTYAREGAPVREVGPVDLDEVVADAVADFAAGAQARALDLVAEPAPDRAPVGVIGDRVALRQAVANLVANAVRLAPEGTAVRLAAGREGPWAWLAVDDAGPGVPAEDHERVFERFWRGDPQRARAEGRSGLGLAIVRRVAALHGGEVRLVANARGGSTFTLWLPAVAPEPDLPSDPDPTPTRSPLVATARSRLRSHRPPDQEPASS
jgi:signal transduction histidine kinase